MSLFSYPLGFWNKKPSVHKSRFADARQLIKFVDVKRINFAYNAVPILII